MSTNIDDILKNTMQSVKGSELKPGFDKRVLLAIQRKKKRAKRVFAIYVGIGSSIILGFSGYLLIVFKAQFSAASGYLHAIIVFGLILLLLQVLDKKLVKDRMMKNFCKK